MVNILNIVEIDIIASVMEVMLWDDAAEQLPCRVYKDTDLT
jgi:hypothetical protein